MPAIKIVNQGTSVNAISTSPFRTIRGPALVSLYASCVNATDTIGFAVANQEILRNASPNIESSADVVDTDRDMILAREPVPAGEMTLSVTATTAVNVLIVIEEVG